MALRLKPFARSLSARAEFLGLELEDWGFVIAWAIVVRLIADHIHRVFVGFVPVPTVMTYGSAALLVVLIHWAKHAKPHGYLVAWQRKPHEVSPMSRIALTIIGVVNKSGGVPALRAAMAAQPPKPAEAEVPAAETPAAA